MNTIIVCPPLSNSPPFSLYLNLFSCFFFPYFFLCLTLFSFSPFLSLSHCMCASFLLVMNMMLKKEVIWTILFISGGNRYCDHFYFYYDCVFFSKLIYVLFQSPLFSPFLFTCPSLSPHL